MSPKLHRRNLATALASAPDPARGQAPFTPAAAAETLRADLRTWRFDVTDSGKVASLLAQLGI